MSKVVYMLRKSTTFPCYLISIVSAADSSRRLFQRQPEFQRVPAPNFESRSQFDPPDIYELKGALWLDLNRYCYFLS